MKIVFTSFYKTYFKDNTKNYITILNKCDFFFAYNMGGVGLNFVTRYFCLT